MELESSSVDELSQNRSFLSKLITSELHELRQHTSHMDTIRLYGKRPYSLIAGIGSGFTSSPRARASW